MHDNNEKNLRGKIVFITGASSGIGAACAEHFAKLGSKLLLCARREDRLLDLAQHLQKNYNTQIFTFGLDIRKYNEVKQKLALLADEWREIDILVNNAGLSRGLDKLQDGSPNDWDEMIDTNLKGLLYVTRLILPQMIQRNSGHIINIGSISGHDVYVAGNVYCATKYAVNAISKSLRMDLLGTNIRVTAVDPGAVETEFSLVRFRGNSERASAVYQGMRPLTPADVASAVIYCASCPLHVNISELRIMPTDQASVSMVHRSN